MFLIVLFLQKKNSKPEIKKKHFKATYKTKYNPKILTKTPTNTHIKQKQQKYKYTHGYKKNSNTMNKKYSNFNLTKHNILEKNKDQNYQKKVMK